MSEYSQEGWHALRVKFTVRNRLVGLQESWNDGTRRNLTLQNVIEICATLVQEDPPTDEMIDAVTLSTARAGRPKRKRPGSMEVNCSNKDCQEPVAFNDAISVRVGRHLRCACREECVAAIEAQLSSD